MAAKVCVKPLIPQNQLIVKVEDGHQNVSEGYFYSCCHVSARPCRTHLGSGRQVMR